MCTKYKIVPFCPYHFVRTILSNTILSVYHFVSTILSATILSGRPQFCSRPRLFHLLIVTSLHYFFKVSIVSLSVCYVIIALFSASIVPSSVCCISMLYLEGFRCFFFRSDGCVIALLPASAVSSSVCCVTILFIQALYCFIICLLRHCSLVDFDCSVFCLLRHYTISSRFPLFRYLLLRNCSVLGLWRLLFCLFRHYTYNLLKISIVSLSVIFTRFP